MRNRLGGRNDRALGLMIAFQALLIGLVQGISELLPISSTGHVLIVPYILGWKEPTPSVHLAMIAGTLIALLFVFGSKLREMFSSARGRDLASLLVIGALPAAVIGLALTTVLQRVFGRPVGTSAMIGISGYLLLLGERAASEQEERVREERVLAARATVKGEAPAPVHPLRGDEETTPIDAVLAGAAQGAGFVPGISRMGATMAVALKVGLNRETAMRYAFLLTVPSLVVALIADIPRITSVQPLSMIAAFAASIAGGVLAIRWFTKVFTKVGLKPFGIYCFAAMVAGMLAALARG
ncbi:MAG: undecaprenyl-diphosphate phosphatase [Actinomycetota bacterium]